MKSQRPQWHKKNNGICVSNADVDLKVPSRGGGAGSRQGCSLWREMSVQRLCNKAEHESGGMRAAQQRHNYATATTGLLTDIGSSVQKKRLESLSRCVALMRVGNATSRECKGAVIPQEMYQH
jgi:hypothetical protein